MNPALEAYINNAKEALQMAAQEATHVKGKAEEIYKKQTNMGLFRGSFDDWAAQNYPMYLQARSLYQQRSAVYSQVLAEGGGDAYAAWEQQVKKASLLPDGSIDRDAIVSPA